MAAKVGIPSEFRCGSTLSSTRYSDTQLSSRQMAKGNSTTTMTDDDSDSNSGTDTDNISNSDMHADADDITSRESDTEVQMAHTDDIELQGNASAAGRTTIRGFRFTDRIVQEACQLGLMHIRITSQHGLSEIASGRTRRRSNHKFEERYSDHGDSHANDSSGSQCPNYHHHIIVVSSLHSAFAENGREL